MSEYTFVWTFQADNITEAEDLAAMMKYETERGRTALYYTDPITGEQALWAEPVMGYEELEARRSVNIREVIENAVRTVESMSDAEIISACNSGLLDRRFLLERGL